MTDLRPLSIGELIDRSAGFWRVHWRPLFRLVLGFQLVQFVCLTASQLLSRRVTTVLVGLPPKEAEQALLDALPTLGANFAGALALWGLAIFTSLLAGMAVSLWAWPRYVGGGDEPSVGAATQATLRRLGRAVGASALSLGWAGVVGLGFMLPGAALVAGGAVLTAGGRTAGAVLLVAGLVVLLLGSLLLVLWGIIRFWLLAQTLTLEEGGALRAFRRSGALTSGRVGPGVGGLVRLRLGLLVAVTGTLLVVVSLVTSLPTLVVGGLYGAGLQPGQTLYDVVPGVVLVPLSLAESLVAACFAPLYALFQLAFYADMRARREGLDLELKLAA